MIYIILLIFLSIPVVKYDLLAKKGGENLWFYSSLLLLILVAGLRYRVGGDTIVYMVEFTAYPKLDELRYFDFETARFNPLWYILNAACRSVSDSFTFFQFVHAIILNGTFFWFFRKYCPRFYFSAILVWFVGYWCYLSMEILREALSICMLMWATDWLLNKKYVRYYLICLLALAMHYSAVIMFFLPLAIWGFRRPNWKLQLMLLGVIVVVLIILDLPAMILGHFAFNEVLELSMDTYLEGKRNFNGIMIETIGYLPVLGTIWLRERNGIDDDEFDFTALVSCMFIFTGFSYYIGTAERFLYYLVPFFVVYFVNTLYALEYENCWRYKNISALVTVAVVFLLSFKYFQYYFRDRSDVYPNTRSYAIFVPYHTVFNPVVDSKREAYVENLRDFAIIF